MFASVKTVFRHCLTLQVKPDNIFSLSLSSTSDDTILQNSTDFWGRPIFGEMDMATLGLYWPGPKWPGPNWLGPKWSWSQMVPWPGVAHGLPMGNAWVTHG